MLHALVMAGGAGTRFWPESRKQRPKQLLPLAGEESLLQQTVARLQDLIPPQRLLVLTNQQLVAPIRRQLPQLPPESVLGEPCKRDTAPCVGLAAFYFQHRDPQAVMLVCPADHVIRNTEAFQQAVRQGMSILEQGQGTFVTFGIRPHYPAETFGYIQRGEPLPQVQEETGSSPAYHVVQFHEKPNAQRAREYLQAGTFYWNSGIFLWRAADILAALRQFQPAMYEHLAQISQSFDTPQFAETFARCFAAIEGTSIDYAVMEKAQGVVVVEAPFDWDDLGSWQALARLHGADPQGNTILGRHLGIESRGLIVRSQGDHLVATLGVEDLIIVHTPDVTLVARKDCEEQIRQLVRRLEQQGQEEFL